MSVTDRLGRRELESHAKAMHDTVMLRPTAIRPKNNDNLDGSDHPHPKPLMAKTLAYSITAPKRVADTQRNSGVGVRDNSALSAEARTTTRSGSSGDIPIALAPALRSIPRFEELGNPWGGRARLEFSRP